MRAQIIDIEMEDEYLDVTARLETSDGVRLRAYLLSSRNGRIAVGTVLHTLDERANPVLALLEHSCMPHMKLNSVVGVAEESAKQQQIILVTAVQNSALDVIGAKIADLQSEHIRAVRYVSEILAQGTLQQSPFALHTLMENFHSTHRHLLDDKDYKRFKRFSDERQQLREFMFSNTQINVVNKEHKRLLFLEERTSWDPQDEASMVPEATLMTLISRFPEARITLIGDSKQLPPYVGVQNVPLAVAMTDDSKTIEGRSEDKENNEDSAVETVLQPVG
ncbi:hypothetical protein OSTOST_05795 [Ostertagia ostertagi]